MTEAKYPDVIDLISGTYQAMSVNYAIRQGRMDIYQSQQEPGTLFTLNPKDKSSAQLNRMIAEVNVRVSESETLKALLEKPTWDRHDRELWESSISNIARDAVHDEPNFGTYRHDKTNAATLNAITEKTNFHCEPMALLHGLLLQSMENHYLKPTTDGNLFKRQVDYYMAGGQLEMSAFNTGKKPQDYFDAVMKGEVLHGYLISPLTANYFEGTQGRERGWNGQATSSYKETRIKNYTFEDYLAGFPLLTEDAVNLTVGYDGTLEAQRIAQQRLALIAKGDYASLATVNFSKYNVAHQPQFFDQRNALLAFKPEADNINNDYADYMKFANEAMTGPGRSYLELQRDADNIDFAMTDDEFARSVHTNRIMLWAKASPAEFRMSQQQGFAKALGGKKWERPELISFLEGKSFDVIWVNRPLTKGQTFDQAVRAGYDQLPEPMRNVMGADGKSTPIPFDDYLTLAREQAAKDGTKPENIDKTGTLVPLLMNPELLWQCYKERNGRSEDTYLREDVGARAYTIVSIVDNPGTKHDSIKLTMDSVINGLEGTYSQSAVPIKIEDVKNPPPAKKPLNLPNSRERQ